MDEDTLRKIKMLFDFILYKEVYFMICYFGNIFTTWDVQKIIFGMLKSSYIK